MKTLAIIPARKGSKRFPKKNIRVLSGKPLVAWTIGAALCCRILDKIVVTTDALKVKEIAKNLNVHIIDRPKELCTDVATSESAAIHAMKLHPEYDVCVFLQTGAPLMNERDIEEAFKYFVDNDFPAVVSVNANYEANGAIYIIKRSVLFKEKSFWVEGMGLYRMPNIKSIDIDYRHQFYIAEAVINKRICE